MIKPTNWWKEKFVTFVAEHTPECHDMTRLISQSLEGPLPLRTRIVMRVHYWICAWCARYRDQLVFLRKAVKSCPEHGEEKLQGNLTAEARERLKEALRKKE